MSRKIAELVIKLRIPIIVLILAVSGFLATRFAGIRVVTNLDDFAPRGHPYVKVQKLMEKWFMGGNMVQVMLTVKEGTILKPDPLKKLINMNRDVRFMEGVITARLHSIADTKVKLTHGYPDGWIARRLITMVPKSKEDEEFLKKSILEDDLVYGKLVSHDFKSLLIRAAFREDIDYKKLFKSFRDMQAEYTDDNTVITVSGRPMMLGWIDYYQKKLIPVFALAILIMAALLYTAFRSKRGVGIPMLSGLICVIWGMGIMDILGYQLDPMASMVPFIILGIGISHSVQFIKRYYEECASGKDSKAAATEVIAVLLGPAATAVITDGFAFATIITVKIQMLQVLAVIGSLSILSIFVNVIFFIPCCLSFLPKPTAKEVSKEEKAGFFDWMLSKIGYYSTIRKGAWVILCLFLVVVSVCIVGTCMMQIGGRAPGAGAFYDDSPYAKETRAIGEKFAGAISYFLVLEADEPNKIKAPRVMRDIEGLQYFLNEDPRVGDSLTLVDYDKRMNVVVHGGDEKIYCIPRLGNEELGYYKDEKGVRQAVGEYLFLYSMGTCGEFDFIVDYEYRTTNIQVFLKDMEAATVRRVLKETKDYVGDSWKSKDVKVHIAGGLAGIVGAINEELKAGMVGNITQISLIVFLFCAILLRSIVGAIIVMISLFTRLVIVYGVMGFAPMPLTMYTMPVAALGIGIGVDYVIYVITRIQEELSLLPDKDMQKATIRALTTTGRAVVYTVMSVVIGVLIFVLSPLKFQMELGTMIGLIIFLNGLGALCLISPIIYLLKPKFIYKYKG